MWKTSHWISLSPVGNTKPDRARDWNRLNGLFSEAMQRKSSLYLEVGVHGGQYEGFLHKCMECLRGSPCVFTWWLWFCQLDCSTRWRLPNAHTGTFFQDFLIPIGDPFWALKVLRIPSWGGFEVIWFLSSAREDQCALSVCQLHSDTAVC